LFFLRLLLHYTSGWLAPCPSHKGQSIQNVIKHKPNTKTSFILQNIPITGSILYIMRNRGSSVRIVTRLGAGRQKVRFLAGELNRFFFFATASRPSVRPTHPASYPMGTDGLFHGGKVAGPWS